MASTVLAPSSTATSPSSPSFDHFHRQSLVSSSGASFQTARTAPLSAASHNSLSSSRSSSAHTLGPTSSSNREPENVNPMHIMSRQAAQNIHSQEVHIVKVTGDKVQLEAGPVPDTLFTKVGRSLMHVVPSDTLNDKFDLNNSNIGPPPPSPPASVEQDDHTEGDMFPPPVVYSKSEPIGRPVIFEDTVRERQPSIGSREGPRPFPRYPPSAFSRAGPSSHESLHRASTETRLSTLTSRTATSAPHRVHQLSGQSDDSNTLTTDTPFTDPSGSQMMKVNLSADGYLQPPPIPSHRPTRRNTTGSNVKASLRMSMQVAGQSSQSYGVEDADIEDDIQMQAEQIRRERKRAKAQQEAEAALTRKVSMQRGGSSRDEETKVLVGNLIGEDHVNYVLMYNMLTGIRIAVSRCQAKIKRPITEEDFTARHKYSFDIVGNELTPSAKYDFKFKDYAPNVFRELREDYFQLDPADYLLSLTAKYILSELGSPGKSGSFFYFSRDYRFIIKTIRHSEHKFLLSILSEYYSHVKNNPHTLLSRFYGLHRVKLPRGRKIHFVIMNNLFPPHKDIHETFDLKGSTVGRLYSEEKASQNPRAVLKDLNWINRGKMLELGPEKRALLTEQLRRDSELLKKVHVMDYSLLVGIHNVRRGNRDNVRSNTLKVFSPAVPPIRRKITQIKGGRSPEAIAMRQAMRTSDPKRLGAGTLNLPEVDTGDRQHFIFYQDDGGLQATDESNEPADTIYYLGVIDILTPYASVKKLEHFWKGLKADRHKISPVPPVEYADRFFNFMKAIMRGGGGGGRFKAE